MRENNKVVLGSTFGDQFGLDITSPSNHKVSSTIQDAENFYRNQAYQRKAEQKIIRQKFRFKKIYDPKDGNVNQYKEAHQRNSSYSVDKYSGEHTRRQMGEGPSHIDKILILPSGNGQSQHQHFIQIQDPMN